MLPWMTSANPSAVHRSGQRAAATLAKARQEVAKFLQVNADQLIFTSGGTESNNLGLWGSLGSGGHVLVSPVEHPSVMKPLLALSSSGAIELEVLEVDEAGLVDLEQIQAKIKPDTKMIVVQAVNSETGALQPVQSIGQLALTCKVGFFCDAAQWVSGYAASPVFPGMSLLSLSAHKFGGPKGVGLLFVQDPRLLQAQQFGGDQEQALRPGTPNIPGVVGLAEALKIIGVEKQQRTAHFVDLKLYLYQGLLGLGTPVLPLDAPAVPHISSFLFPGENAQRLLMRLDLQGLEVSSGSACSLGKDEASPVLLAMSLAPGLAKSVLRFSFGPQTEKQDLDRLFEGLKMSLKVT